MTYHSIPLLGCCTSGKWIATHESKRKISHKSMVYTMVFTTYFIHLHLWKLGILGDHLLVFVIQYTLYIHYILGLYHGYPPIRPQSWLISWSIGHPIPSTLMDQQFPTPFSDRRPTYQFDENSPLPHVVFMNLRYEFPFWRIHDTYRPRMYSIHML